MRSFYTILVSLGCALGMSNAAEHNFTSADGSKILTATIENYWPDKQTALIKTQGKRLTVPLSAFKSEDKQKFDKWYQTSEAGRSIRIDFDIDKQKKNERKLSNATITQFNSSYQLEVRNNAETDFDKVVLKYRLFYKQDLKKNNELVEAGEFKLDSIAAKETKTFTTANVQLTSAKPKT